MMGGEEETIMNDRLETPNLIVFWMSKLVEFSLKGGSARSICDPWLKDAGLLWHLKKATGAKVAVGLTESSDVAAEVGRHLAGAHIEVGDPLELLRKSNEFDVIAGVLPFGMQNARARFENPTSGDELELSGEFGHLLLFQAGLRLKADGVGVFVV